MPLNLDFYRDSQKVEIGIFIDTGTELYNCEIKSAQIFTKEFLTDLKNVFVWTDIPVQNYVIYR